MARPEIAVGVSETPVSLPDVAAMIPALFALDSDCRSLPEIAQKPVGQQCEAQSKDHAVGAVSGGMIFREGRWKLNWYVDFAPGFSNLVIDTEELVDLTGDPAYSEALQMMKTALHPLPGSRTAISVQAVC
ncbi:hypothetical protein [Sulfitobacter sp.]|uniref:hypothetical protein n=1 Tax=Sulfitobacter sp. TaxID=1903071 RepID=UPI003002984D